MRLALLTCLALAPPAGAADMNISQFVFRDLNRNGVYEVGESPYAGIPVRLTQSGQAPVVRESNLAGFANFVMSDGEGDITEPGPLEFVVEPPDGLEVTTGNLRQFSNARRLDGSPAGIVIEPTLPFVGVAPTLSIESGASGSEKMTCDGAGGTVTAEPVASGALSCAVSPGDWIVTWTVQNGETESREVTVENWPLRVPRPLAGTSVGGQETTVRFDDILSSENIQEVPSGHGGVRWHNFVAAHHKFYQGWGYVNGTVSGEYAAYNSSGHPARIYAETPFDFLGAIVSVAWPSAMESSIRIEALRDGKVVAADTFVGSNLRPIRFDPDWKGVDEVRVSHGTYWQVILDDVTLRR